MVVFVCVTNSQAACAALLIIITAAIAAILPSGPYILQLSSVSGEWWRIALNCPRMWTCWQQLAYSTTFNSNTDTLCHNSVLEAVARQACHCTPILLTNGWVLRTHCLEWWMGPLCGIGDVAAGLSVHPGACVWYWNLEAWVILFVCTKPDGLMSVGPLCWTGQNEIFETKCCEMLGGNASDVWVCS